MRLNHCSVLKLKMIVLRFMKGVKIICNVNSKPALWIALKCKLSEIILRMYEIQKIQFKINILLIGREKYYYIYNEYHENSINFHTNKY